MNTSQSKKFGMAQKKLIRLHSANNSLSILNNVVIGEGNKTHFDLVRTNDLDTDLTLKVTSATETALVSRDVSLKQFGAPWNRIATGHIAFGPMRTPEQPAVEYPEIIYPEKRVDLSVQYNGILDAINFCLPAVSKDLTRPALVGLLVENPETHRSMTDGPVMVATDGHRLHYHPTYVEGTHDEDFIMPAKVAKALQALPKDTDGGISFHHNGVHYAMWMEAVNFMVDYRFRPLEGPYPDWRQVIPKDNDIKLTIPREELLLAVKEAMTVANKATKLVRLSFNGSSLEVSAGEDEYHYQNAVICSGPDPQKVPPFGMNGNYLIDTISRFTHDTVDISLKVNHERYCVAGGAMTNDRHSATDCSCNQVTSAIHLSTPWDAGKAIIMPMRLVS